MGLRDEIVRCLRERVLNSGSDGRAFMSPETHRAWLFGNGEGLKGLFADPLDALGLAMPGHPGVRVQPSELPQVEALFRSLGEHVVTGGGTAEQGISIPDPTDPTNPCWY